MALSGAGGDSPPKYWLSKMPYFTSEIVEAAEKRRDVAHVPEEDK